MSSVFNEEYFDTLDKLENWKEYELKLNKVLKPFKRLQRHQSYHRKVLELYVSKKLGLSENEAIDMVDNFDVIEENDRYYDSLYKKQGWKRIHKHTKLLENDDVLLGVSLLFINAATDLYPKFKRQEFWDFLENSVMKKMIEVCKNAEGTEWYKIMREKHGGERANEKI
mgnify:CR=1 FL=1